MPDTAFIRWFTTLGNDDVPLVGGKNASMGEMLSSLQSQGVRVPDGFATTADAYRGFIEHNQLADKLKNELQALEQGEQSLSQAGTALRRLVTRSSFPQDFEQALRNAYDQLCQRYDQEAVDVAARSSATAEDLPEASFAGQQETFLNITGADELLDAVKRCFASLFTDRAISYREEQGFDHLKVALSVGVQKMVRSDKASSGVLFSLDTETGFPRVVLINGAWGLGETVVQGTVTPDEFRVFKPLLDDTDLLPIVDKVLGAKEQKMVYAAGGSKTTKTVATSNTERQSYVLNDQEVLTLSRWAVAIEKHYKRPMDMEWAKDGQSGELYIVQARPETVQSQKDTSSIKAYELKEQSEVQAQGLSVGDAIAVGPVQRIKSADDIETFTPGSVLVTTMTDPDWVPIMKQAAAIVTDHGGRTSHAAIVSRELGIPAVVGAGNAMESLHDGQQVTVSCAEGELGVIYKGELDFEQRELALDDLPETRTEIMCNIASPAAAFRWWRLPVHGVGLARMEFLINNVIKIHPLALLQPDKVDDKNDRQRIDELTRGYSDKGEYFIEHLARGLAKVAAAMHPHPVLVRMSDFKSNEYAQLIGGAGFEPDEANPMLGFRGASRYYSDDYAPGFALECAAVKRAREVLGFGNIKVMIPFCRTPQEADKVLETMARNDLERGKNGLEVHVMAEIPSNVLLADEFAQRFDGFSIGSNDLTQLVLGVDRDSGKLAHLFDEQNEAVKRMISMLIQAAHDESEHPRRHVGICGQGPSDHPEFARFLVEAGIDAVSLNPDSVLDVIKTIAQAEKE